MWRDTLKSHLDGCLGEDSDLDTINHEIGRLDQEDLADLVCDVLPPHKQEEVIKIVAEDNLDRDFFKRMRDFFQKKLDG